MKKKIVLLNLLLFCNYLTSQSQIIDYIQGYVGTRIFPMDENLDPTSKLPQNFYAGFSPGQVIGATALRQVTDHICIGAGFEISNTVKPHYNLNINTINTYIKYNFNNIEYFISPYVIAGPNLSFISVSQSAFQDLRNTDGNSSNQSQLVYPTKILYREEKVDLFFVPVMGLLAGGGLEFKITEGWGIYGQYSFYYLNTKVASLLQETYNFNKTNMYFHNITAGIRFFL